MSAGRPLTKSACILALLLSSSGSFAQQGGPGSKPALPAKAVAANPGLGSPISLSFAASGGPIVEALAWSWGVSNSGTTHQGGGGGSGKANVQDLSVTKYTDSFTPALIEYVATGVHLPEVTLTQGGLVLTIKDVLVTSVSTGGSSGEVITTENISLNFAAFTISVDGQSFGFNIGENQAQ